MTEKRLFQQAVKTPFSSLLFSEGWRGGIFKSFYKISLNPWSPTAPPEAGKPFFQRGELSIPRVTEWLQESPYNSY